MIVITIIRLRSITSFFKRIKRRLQIQVVSVADYVRSRHNYYRFHVPPIIVVYQPIEHFRWFSSHFPGSIPVFFQRTNFAISPSISVSAQRFLVFLAASRNVFRSPPYTAFGSFSRPLTALVYSVSCTAYTTQEVFRKNAFSREFPTLGPTCVVNKKIVYNRNDFFVRDE